MNDAIKFGTDGWRAVIADGFTFDNLRRISKATAITFDKHPKISNGIVIGYDTRFLSKEFAECSAAVFANHGIKVYLTDSFVTTPTVSLLTRDKNFAFGVVITSSHNPPEYNGFKLKDEFGGSMGVTELKKIESNLRSFTSETDTDVFEVLLKEKQIEYVTGKTYYINNLRNKINIDAIKKAGIKVIYDAMYGSGQGMMDELIQVDSIRSEVNPSFGGIHPEPVEKNLMALSEKLKTGNYDIGIATDGDADRVAIVEEKGNFIDAQKTFALLLVFLLDYKKMKGSVVRGFSGSELIKRICDDYKLRLSTVPIGFKYISELMIKDDVLIGAEESGGIGVKNHLPERDGIFNGLLFCEMLAVTGKKLSNLLKDLEHRFGKYYYKRIDKPLTNNELKNKLIEESKEINELAGMKVINKDTLDGCKMFFDQGWLLVRASGTEPLLRLYTETYNENKTDLILNNILNKFSLN
jgi:phosphomannomutase